MTSPSRSMSNSQRQHFRIVGSFLLAGDDARAHFDARRLVAVVVAMELQAAFAADQRPVVTFGRAVRRGNGPARRGRRGLPSDKEPERPACAYFADEILQVDPFEHGDDGRQIGVAENVANEIEQFGRFGRRHLDDLEHERVRMVDEIDVIIFPFADQRSVAADAMPLRQRGKRRTVRAVGLGISRANAVVGKSQDFDMTIGAKQWFTVRAPRRR